MPRKRREDALSEFPEELIEAMAQAAEDTIIESSVKPTRRRRRRGVSPGLMRPMVPIRDSVYYPGMVFTILVGRDRSLRALDIAAENDRKVILLSQIEPEADDPVLKELYSVGVVAEIMQHMRVPDGSVRVMLEAQERVRAVELVDLDGFALARYEPFISVDDKDIDLEPADRMLRDLFGKFAQESGTVPPEAHMATMGTTDPGRLVNQIAPWMQQLDVAQKISILEGTSVHDQILLLIKFLTRELEVLEVQKDIRGRVEQEMADTQRDYFLREQMRIIQHELGEREGGSGDPDDYKSTIKAAEMPAEVQERALKELERLDRMPYAAPEGSVIRTYIDWLISLPWSIRSDDALDIAVATATLDTDHHGLQKVKERILEFLAVRQLVGSGMKGPILCFVGPPGVGKTSIGKSIANALGRKFVRISLGGVRDEAEIRGHRRTYIGSMPGRIIQGIKTAGTSNPVFMLDEIDKLGMDYRGDPSSALLEALDPEQNSEFSDHYIEAAFNLRDVMFITTANLLDPIPAALRDRMEVITFSAYTEEEKLAIARDFLVPKQLTQHGLMSQQNGQAATADVSFTEGALHKLIRDHTREAGVRNLERQIGSICRKIAVKVARNEAYPSNVDSDDVATYLGRARYRYGMREDTHEIGAVTGLVYTEFGGDTLTIEVAILPGKGGKLELTGHMGKVMKESARTAFTCVRTAAQELGLKRDFYKDWEIHLHVPEGGVPKDGPSAGITMATAIASAFTGRPARKDIAMTGEITLRGRVLPIGGVKEKVLAAHRAGIRTVVLPMDNQKDLEDIPQHVQDEMTFHFVERVQEVFAHILDADTRVKRE